VTKDVLKLIFSLLYRRQFNTGREVKNRLWSEVMDIGILGVPVWMVGHRLYNIQANEWRRQDDIPRESLNGDLWAHRSVTIKNKDKTESVFVFGGRTDRKPNQLKDLIEFSLSCHG
jgi:hypothetical protein